jgi:transcriptional regulator with XRE-family HTH domain
MPRGTPRLRTPQNKINQIGPRVSQRRQNLGLKQDELCGRLALETNGKWSPAWQDISRIENGVRIVSDLEVLALAHALECGACWLLGEDATGQGGG